MRFVKLMRMNVKKYSIVFSNWYRTIDISISVW